MTNPIVTEAMRSAARKTSDHADAASIPELNAIYLAMSKASGPKVDEVREVACRMRVLAVDCELTDGWQDSAEDCLKAADLLDSLGDAKG